jgi:hypothetical protein
MSEHLYVLFARQLSGALDAIQHTDYLVWPASEGQVIRVPGELEVPVARYFYAQNYYRVFIAEKAIEFAREAHMPKDFLADEKRILRAVLDREIRRWIVTVEGWDDEDRPMCDIVFEGEGAESLRQLD